MAISIDKIFSDHIPDRLGHEVDVYVEENLERLINLLPRIDELPRPDELDNLTFSTGRQPEPVLLNKIPTVNDLAKHLSVARPDTPEIAITAFPGGSVVALEVGTPESIVHSLFWLPFKRLGSAYLHTQPDPRYRVQMRTPSLGDLMSRGRENIPEAIGSHDGLTILPSRNPDPDRPFVFRRWAEYLSNIGANVDPHGEANCSSNLFEEFLRIDTGVKFIGWNALKSEMLLDEAIIQLDT